MNVPLKMMTETENVHGLKPVPTLIVGLGITGLSCVRFLAQLGVPLAVTDDRQSPPGVEALSSEFEDVTVSLGSFDPGLFEWAQRIVVSPGVSIDEPLIAAARARGAEVVGDIELFAQAAKAPVVAITGSNGKSTVVTLLGEMATAAGKDVRVGGNIGTPALSLLADAEPDFYILELSSFQLETTSSLNAAVSVVLNVSPDHMDRYCDLLHYSLVKQRVYQGEGTMLVNRDDAAVVAMVQDENESSRSILSFGLGEAADNQFGRVLCGDELWLAQGCKPLLSVSELRIAGEHNQANALAALALGSAMGIPMDAMLSTLKTFSGLPHRTQWVAEIIGVRWYNDSKGTNVGATLSAIQGLSGPLILIAGGQGKGADFMPLRAAVKDKVRAVVLIGEDASKIEHALVGVAPMTHAGDMVAAVQQAQALAQQGDSVLLSPACASFDMYAGYADRGDAFVQAVHSLQAEAQS